MSFLGARATARPAIVIAGVPYDATSTFRSGSRHAPDAIRWASQSIETYSPILGRDLTEVAFADVGDLDVAAYPPEQMVTGVETWVTGVIPGAVPILIGGEHTITVGAVRALHRQHADLAIVLLDAHTDLREEYEGKRTCHATVVRRLMDTLAPTSILQLGIRAGTREEFEVASRLRHSGPQIALPSLVWSWLEERPTYVSVDIDALDPADAPGTGNPEPAGISSRDLVAFIRRLGALHIVGLDLVEVSPPYDPSGRTAVLAATIVREAILAIAGQA